MSKKQQKDTIPSCVTNAIGEHSPSGYILCVVNQQGKPEIYTYFDSDIVALALHKFTLLWAEATEMNQEASFMNMISPPPSKESEDTE